MRPAWKNLTRFSRERDIDWRLAWDIENAKRTNYRRSTLAAIEAAYGWAPGSIDAVLRGREPVLTDQPRVEDDDPRPALLRDLVSVSEWESDEQLRSLWDLDRLSPLARVGVIAEYLDRLREDQEAGTSGPRRAAR